MDVLPLQQEECPHTSPGSETYKKSNLMKCYVIIIIIIIVVVVLIIVC